MSNHRYKDKEKSVSATNPAVIKVARGMSRKLDKLGVEHALIGGLAVSAHGYERATADVDFLVTTKSREQIAGNSLGGEVEGKTVRVKAGVDVDFLFPKEGQSFLNAAVRRAERVGGIPTIPVEVLVYLKLVAARARDEGDVVELLKRNVVDRQKTAAYLRRHRPDLVEDFESLCLQADVEAR